MPLSDESAWPRLVAEIEAFLGEPDRRSAEPEALSLEKLTKRERTVLEGIAEGLNNSEIATALGLSEKPFVTTSPGYSTRFP